MLVKIRAIFPRKAKMTGLPSKNVVAGDAQVKNELLTALAILKQVQWNLKITRELFFSFLLLINQFLFFVGRRFSFVYFSKQVFFLWWRVLDEISDWLGRFPTFSRWVVLILFPFLVACRNFGENSKKKKVVFLLHLKRLTRAICCGSHNLGEDVYWVRKPSFGKWKQWHDVDIHL